MRLVHLSDLHLGFRQYQRQTAAGINQREADVAQAFARAVDRLIQLAPDVILIGGDVFHTVRPTNTAILHAFRQFSRLVTALPRAHVVVVAGNHDMPRSTETICILRLFEQGFVARDGDGTDQALPALPIYVADREARRIRFPHLDLAVLAVPDLPPGTVELTPDPTARYNVLLMHGEVQGALPAADDADRAAMQIPVEELTRPGWDYVALGHYHVYKRLADHVYYSGSLEYTSSNPWGELAEEKAARLPGKGMIERDLGTGKQTFHPLPATRPVLDLAPIEGRGMSAAELDAAIQQAVGRITGGLDGKVVRLVARNVPRHIARELDHKALRELQKRALHFHLDMRRPELVRRAPATGSGAPGRRPSLADTLREALRARPVVHGVEREALVALGLRYLEEAELAEPARDLPGGDG
ncbi:MAG: DNA repair exonuclease [Gemmatimonadaceae bacterium]|nr:DNA repair exonuclease [Gemmatimonadaceae bacterium]